MKIMKQFLGILLSLALVLSLAPGMSLTAHADDPYASLKNTTTEVHFDGKDWYLIDYDDSTVTLLAKECIGASEYSFDSSYVEYDQSKVKVVVDNYYTNEFSAAAKTVINGNKMFLLTAEQAGEITNENVLKCSMAHGAELNYWWLCSQSDDASYMAYYAAHVYGDNGSVSDGGSYVQHRLGVRPALKLNLSSVIFSPDTNTFSVECTVTYKVVNGTWSDGTTADKTESVVSGSHPVNIPTGMIASEGCTGGAWNTDPANATITAATTFTYTFSSDSDGSLIVESADGAPACEVSGLSSDDIFAIAEAEDFAGAGAPDFALKLKVSNIDETVSAEEKEIAENYVAAMGEDVRIAMYTDMSLFLVGGGQSRQVTNLRGRKLTINMTIPGSYLPAPAGFTRHFLVFHIHNGAVTEVGRSTTLRLPITAGSFSTYVLAYYDVEEGGSGSHEHSHHICEDGHKFAYCVMQAPTTEVDGFAEWRCTQCGIYDWNDHDNADARETVTLSAYPVFNDTLENNIKAASAGATVSIETKRWVSVRRGVLEALAQKPGVTLSIKFAKDGSDYVLTIPGGDPALAGILASEDRFFNFMTLGNTYGLTEVEK